MLHSRGIRRRRCCTVLVAVLTAAAAGRQHVQLNLGRPVVVARDESSDQVDAVRYRDVCQVGSTALDLHIVADRGDTPLYLGKRGANASEDFGSLSFKHAATVGLVFRFFRAGTFVPAKVEQVRFTFLLGDRGERLQIRSCDRYFLAPATELRHDDAGSTLEVSIPPTALEPASFNAGDSHELTADEEKYAVTVQYEDVAQFTISVNMVDPLVGTGRKRFTFAGSPHIHDCQVGHPETEGTWSPSQRAWCCRSQGKRCDSSYDCDVGTSSLWSEAKLAWCCGHRRLGCGALPRAAAAAGSPGAPARALSAEDGAVGQFDCQAGLWNWHTEWPEDKKEWCCAHELRFCPDEYLPQVAAGNTASESALGCDAGNQASWSQDEALRCCAEMQIGCSPQCSTICTVGAVSASCASRVVWAMKNQFAAQTGPDVCNSAQRLVMHDCEECATCNLDSICSKGSISQDACQVDDLQSWPEEKKQACCRDYGIGCEGLFPPYDCRSEIAWGDEKRAWCCKNQRLGCPAQTTSISEASVTATTTAAPATTTTKSGCSADRQEWSRWSTAKRSWCCSHNGKGCATTTSGHPEKYDCMDGPEHLEARWTIAKSEWCCQHHLRGCANNGRPRQKKAPPHDCEVGPGDWLDGWSLARASWCCEHFSMGCTKAASKHVDCFEGIGDWKSTWPDTKKRWCCQHKGMGCVETTKKPPYDCSSGVSASSSHWPEGKQAWCCLYEHVGCREETLSTTSTSSFPYSCETGLYDWEKGWSYEKKEWCCIYGSSLVRNHLHEGLNCPTSHGEEISTQIFQRKFKQVGEQMVSWEFFKSMLAPVVFGALALMAIVASIRSFSWAPWTRMHARSRGRAPGGCKDYQALAPDDTGHGLETEGRCCASACDEEASAEELGEAARLLLE